MSTIKVNTIQNTSGVEVYTAKAWVNFNGTGTVAIRASGNVSSITDNGTGVYTVNFTNPMPDANYVVCGSGGGTQVSAVFTKGTNADMTTTSVKVQNIWPGSNWYDSEAMCVVVFR